MGVFDYRDEQMWLEKRRQEKAYLMVSVMEECEEVSQRISKALKFGLDEIQQGQELTNEQRLGYEIIDLVTTLEVLEEKGYIQKNFGLSEDVVSKMKEDKKVKIEKWFAHSRKNRNNR